MKNIIIGLVLFLFLGCAANHQPTSAIELELGLKYADFNPYIKGKITYQEMSKDDQMVYVKNPKDIETLKILAAQSGIDLERYLKMKSVAEVEKSIKSDESIPQNQKKQIAEKIDQLPAPINFDIVQLPDQTKGRQVAGKLTWDPHSKMWVKQVVIYNDAPVPERNHPVWSYTSNLVAPAREGRSAWEAYAYKLFN